MNFILSIFHFFKELRFRNFDYKEKIPFETLN